MNRQSNSSHLSTLPASDAAIIGGGLAGLTAAALLARRGLQVTLFERSRTLGGRAQTTTHGPAGDIHFNLGPHAFYLAGPAEATLSQLGITLRGKPPKFKRSFALHRGQLYPLPDAPLAILRSPLFSVREKLSLVKLFLAIQRADPQAHHHLSWAAWLQQQTASQAVQQFFQATARVFTYANAAEEVSAGLVLQMFQRGLSSGVLYLDGGWEQLVHSLEEVALAAGVQIVSGARVTAVDPQPETVQLTLADGTHHTSRSLLLAVDPHTAASLLPHSPTLQPATQLPAIRAATLDVALRQLPQPEHHFAVGIDQAVYFSVHSVSATLAPDGMQVLHVARYLTTAEPPPPKEALLAILDRLQPGWRAQLVTERFLPDLRVVNTLPTAAAGGLPGRPPVHLPDLPHVALCGDWIGPEGWLADASFASARAAAELIAKRLADSPPAVDYASVPA